MGWRQPYLPRFMAGGNGNPLGARALYLGDTLYRIHGTNQPSTNRELRVVRLHSAHNEDISDLYKRVKVGTRVVVLSGKERPNVASPVTSPRAGSSAQRSALSADEKRKQPKEPEPKTPTGSTRGETTDAHNNALQTEVKSENAAFEE